MIVSYINPRRAPVPLFVPMQATGGEVTDIEVDGRPYRLHTFTESGDFEVISVGTSNQVEYFLLGSGGAGAHHNTAATGNGGGSAGQLIKGSAELDIGVYPVVVPAGGVGVNSPSVDGADGASATFLGQVAAGGVGGRRHATTQGGKPGFHGSGAGGASFDDTIYPGGVGSSGRNGGDGWGSTSPTTVRAGGGGAGMGSSGGNAGYGIGGDGGAGVDDDFSGELIGYAGGGGGSYAGYSSGRAGAATHGGGAGSGSAADAGDAAPNRGGGGGGASASRKAGDGGSGLVMVRYPVDWAP